MHYTFKTLSILLLFGILALPTVAQTASWQDTLQKIDALFSKYNINTPGGVLTIARKGKIIYNKAFGMADLEHNLANTPETIFEAGSVSKQFTAAAILLLADEGKLSLEDDVRRYIPELPDYSTPIKIRHLMTHTSGLRDWGAVAAITGWERGKRVHTHAHVLEILSRQKALNFPPGDQYSYCNSGYNLMAIIVDRVSGMSFADFCLQRIFEPMGMKNTQWRDDYRKIIKNRAIAYTKIGDTYLQNMPFEMVHGNGGLLTTTADLITWNQNYKTRQIGGKTFAAIQLVAAKTNIGVSVDYAAGLRISEYNGFKEISHSGATAGYRAWLAYYPEPDISVAFLSNDANVNPGEVGMKVIALFLGERIADEPMLGTIVPDKNSLQQKAGLYKNVRNDDFMRLEVKDELLQAYGRPLQATKINTFYQGSARLEFAENKFVRYTSNGDSATYVKKESFVPNQKELQNFVGAYHSDDVDLTIYVELKGDKLETFIKPDLRSTLNPYYKDAFQNPSGEVLEFQRDKSGKIVRFAFTTGRAWNIPFEKVK